MFLNIFLKKWFLDDLEELKKLANNEEIKKSIQIADKMRCAKENLEINPEDLPSPAKIGLLKGVLIKLIIKNRPYLCEENKTNMYDINCNPKSELAVAHKKVTNTDLRKGIKIFCRDEFQDLALYFCAIEQNDSELLEKFVQENLVKFLDMGIELTENDEKNIENELNCLSKG